MQDDHLAYAATQGMSGLINNKLVRFFIRDYLNFQIYYFNLTPYPWFEQMSAYGKHINTEMIIIHILLIKYNLKPIMYKK